MFLEARLAAADAGRPLGQDAEDRARERTSPGPTSRKMIALFLDRWAREFEIAA